MADGGRGRICAAAAMDNQILRDLLSAGMNAMAILETDRDDARRLRGADEPVSHAEDMPSDYQTGTSRTFQYTEQDYGKVADYATAYENSTGQRGPWLNVTSLLISE
jgi:hypothetical protein